MMKRTMLPFLAFLFLLICGQARAQLKRFSIGPYVEAGWPTGDFDDTHKTGIGAGLTADIKLLAGFTAIGSVGYMRFAGKTIDTGTGEEDIPNLSAIPVRVGLKYKLVSVLYAKLEAGAANFTGDNNGSAFILSPGVGVRLLMFDLQAKYEAWFKDGTNGFLGLKASINF